MTHKRLILAMILFAACLGGARPAKAALLMFDLAWSGVPFSNTSSATGGITIDDSLLTNPGSNSSFSGFITSFDMTVNTGGGVSNFDFNDFDEIVLNTGAMALNFSAELVGQSTGGDPWGATTGNGGDFVIFRDGGANPLAPNAVGFFTLVVGGDGGDMVALTSFRPIPEPATAFLALCGIALLGLRRGRAAKL